MTSRLERYQYRKERVRKKVYGTAEMPRLSVYRSLKYIYAQIVDDVLGQTLLHVSSLDKEVKEKVKSTGNKAAAEAVGKVIAQKALDAKIKKVVFDRGGRIYHGRVKSLADGARAGGLEF